jgi:hypothetical protein
MAEPTASGPGRGASAAPPPPGYEQPSAAADPGYAPGPGASTAGPDPAGVAKGAVQEVIDASADFLVAGRDYIRQEAEGVLREKVAPPLAEVGVTVASMWAAVTFLILGLIFIGVAAIIFLSQLVGPALAFLIVGAIYMIGAGIFLFIKIRQVRASAEALQRSQALRGVGDTSAAATPAQPAAVDPRKAKP